MTGVRYCTIFWERNNEQNCTQCRKGKRMSGLIFLFLERGGRGWKKKIYWGKRNFEEFCSFFCQSWWLSIARFGISFSASPLSTILVVNEMAKWILEGHEMRMTYRVSTLAWLWLILYLVYMCIGCMHFLFGRPRSRSLRLSNVCYFLVPELVSCAMGSLRNIGIRPPPSLTYNHVGRAADNVINNCARCSYWRVIFAKYFPMCISVSSFCHFIFSPSLTLSLLIRDR